MNKRRYEGEQTKINIAQQARTLFSKKGYAATSIQDICQAAECSKGNLYYHFKSKEDLFIYLEEQTFLDWWEQLERETAHCKTFTEKLYIYGNFAAGNERPLYSAEREFINIVGENSEAAQRFKVVAAGSFAKTQKFVAEGIAQGELKKEELFELTLIISSFFSALNYYSLYFMDNEVSKALFYKATTLLLKGIGEEIRRE
ncbi:MAG: TetR/AcrR family transcriptional regulator [Syntrophomonas sp.]